MRIFVPVLLIIFLAGGAYSGYLFYSAVRQIVARADFPSLPVLRLSGSGGSQVSASEPQPGVMPVPGPVEPSGGSTQGESAAPPEVVPSQRINVVLLGIDRRGASGWDTRTDTIIVLTIDPAARTAGMLSIPRDLYLPIPGNGENRINSANVYGEWNNYPGGGPALVKRTIEANFGIPIDFYVMVDFQGFEKIIDTLGGIDINVPKTLHDTQYPDPRPGDPYGYTTVHFDPGWQQMDGERALIYARSRMSTSDFDRAQRQQQVLFAIRDKVLSQGLITNLTKSPQLVSTLLGMVKTDMSLDEMWRLAPLAREINLDNIESAVIDASMTVGYRTDTGAAVRVPIWDQIDPLVAEMFFTASAPAPAVTPTPAPPTPTPTLAPAEMAELQYLAQEGARIAVQNGTTIPNLAADVATWLTSNGYQIVEFGEAERHDYARTVLVDYTGKTYTLERLVELFQVAPENVRRSPNLRSPVDIRVIVGHDLSLPAP
jgi:LCP family protein required for cell wall assembly